jgi:hypothetical protein
MAFKVSATVSDPKLKDKGDAQFSYRIVDNDNFTVDTDGNVEAVPGYSPQIGDKFTVEVSYRYNNGVVSKKRKTFTIKY